MVDAAHCQSPGVFDKDDNTEKDFPPPPDTDQRQDLMPDNMEDEEEEEDTINDIVPV